MATGLNAQRQQSAKRLAALSDEFESRGGSAGLDQGEVSRLRKMIEAATRELLPEHDEAAQAETHLHQSLLELDSILKQQD